MTTQGLASIARLCPPPEFRQEPVPDLSRAGAPAQL